jgi:hypothetical protein
MAASYTVRTFATAMPSTSIKIFCNKCKAKLYVYKKNGTGALVKCFEERIVKDFTNKDLKCPNCLTTFARRSSIAGRPIHKIIGGKVYHRK